MRWLLAEMLRISVGGLLVLSASVCVAAERAATNDTTSAPPVVAHFHLSGALRESPVADPLGLMAGELTSLKDLVRRMDRAGADDKVKAVILTFDEITGGRIYTGKQALDLGLINQLGSLQQAIEYAAAKVSLKDYEVRILPEPKDFFTLLIEQYSGEGERPTDVALPGSLSPFAGHPALAPLLLDLLRKTEPQRVQALSQALQRIDLLRRENVILMMPFDMVLR